MKKSFLFFLTVVFFLVQACSLFNSSDDGGSIILRVPENSSRETFSSSTGSTSVPSSISYYFVRIRKSGEVVQEEKVSPGTSLTIDGLFPGEYTVAILGVNESGIVDFYGRSQDVLVYKGQTSQAAVKLRSVMSMGLTLGCVFLNSDTGERIDDLNAMTFFSVTATGGGMSHYYSVTWEVFEGYGTLQILASTPGDGYEKTVSNFLEPGIPYKISVKASNSDWTRTYSGSVTITLGAGTYPTLYLQ